MDYKPFLLAVVVFALIVSPIFTSEVSAVFDASDLISVEDLPRN